MSDLSLAQIEKMLSKKRVRLDGLMKRRDSILRKLAAVEANIGSIGGDVSKPVRRRRTRPQNERTLYEVVTEVLAGSKAGLDLMELSDAVLATGYKTGSAKFSNTVYQCLYNNSKKIERIPDTNRYRLKAKRVVKRPKAKTAKTEAK